MILAKNIALAVPAYGAITPPAGVPTGGLDRLMGIIQGAVAVTLIVIVLLSLFFIVFGGIKWTISGGDKSAIENARKMITFSIIGLVVSFASFLILMLIGNIFGVKLFIN